MLPPKLVVLIDPNKSIWINCNGLECWISDFDDEINWCVCDLICVLSDVGLPSIRRGKLIKARRIKSWAGIEHIRRLDVRPEEWLMCWQKASCHEFRHQAKKIRHCTKDIGCCEKAICRLSNMSKERTMCWRVGRSAGWTNDMPDNLVFLHVIIYLDRGSLSSNCVGLEYN